MNAGPAGGRSPAAITSIPMLGVYTKSSGICSLGKKLDMDWRAPSPFGVAMDDDTRDLISRLGTRIGMIMEDCSVTALTLGRMEKSELGPAIDTLARAGTSISMLVAALNDLLT